MENKKIVLSVAIAVKNEEKNISSCLSSVKDVADEIVVVDGGSTDKTVEIAKSFGVKLIKTDNPPIFHINKQKALDACRGEWILQLDADEVVTKELKKEIVGVMGQKTMSRGRKYMTGYNEHGTEHGTGDNEQGAEIQDGRQNKLSDADCLMSNIYNGYYIPRKNYFWGHFMKKGGQYPDYVIRLVRRGKARFPCKSVHEQIVVEGDIGYLENPLLHWSYRTLGDYWKKAETYTTLSADELKKNNMCPSLGMWASYVLVKPIRTFISLFVRHKGFYDGIYGFLFAFFSALHYPMTYRKFCISYRCRL